MAPLCEVCHVQDSKYKCPVCALRYCSIPCYRTHRATHPAAASQQQSTHPPNPQPVPPQQPTRSPDHNDPPAAAFRTLAADPTFHALLARYPLLRLQLQTVYALTLDPGPEIDDDNDNDNNHYYSGPYSSRPARGESGTAGHGRGRGRGRGRGASFRGGVGPRGGRGSRTMHGESQMGRGPRGKAWTREKGEREALGALRRMMGRDGGGIGEAAARGEREEGLREFVELCRLRVAREEQSGGAETSSA